MSDAKQSTNITAISKLIFSNVPAGVYCVVGEVLQHLSKILSEGRKEYDLTLHFGPRSFYHISLERVCGRSVGALPLCTDKSPHQYLSSCDLPIIQAPQDGLQIFLTSHCGCIWCLNKRRFRRTTAELGRQKILECSYAKEDNC